MPQLTIMIGIYGAAACHVVCLFNTEAVVLGEKRQIAVFKL